MTKPLRELTKQAIFNVLADMFYLFPEEVSNQDVQDRPGLDYYSILLEGPERTSITIGFSPALGLLMTANFLGEDSATIPEFLIQETLKEALNVIGGQVLNHFGDGWHLGLPGMCDEPVKKYMVQEHMLDLIVHGHPLRVILNQAA